MINITFIESEIRGHWPTSQKITPQYLADLARAFRDSSEEEFLACLDKYRSTEKASRVPEPRDLIRHLKRSQSTPGKMASLFFNSLVMFGWIESVKRGLNYRLGYATTTNDALREWMISVGINENIYEYYGLADWQQMFLVLLHEGKVIDAHRHVELNGPDEIKLSYKQKADQLESVGNEAAKGYFSYFRRKPILDSMNVATKYNFKGMRERIFELAKKMEMEDYNFDEERQRQYQKLKDVMEQEKRKAELCV